MQDELGPDGRHIGWADRVAAAIATRTGGLRYANLAIRGRLLDQVAAEQLPVALELAPELVSFHAGPNDVLRPRGPAVAGILARYDAAVARLRAAGSDVLVFTVLERAGGTGRTADRLAARFRLFNDGVRATAHRHGALLLDVGPIAALHDRRLWHEDRLHLSPEGHARVAAAVLDTLGVHEPALLCGGPRPGREPLPPGPPPRRSADLVAVVRWVRRQVMQWVGPRVIEVLSVDEVEPKPTTL